MHNACSNTNKTAWSTPDKIRSSLLLLPIVIQNMKDEILDINISFNLVEKVETSFNEIWTLHRFFI